MSDENSQEAEIKEADIEVKENAEQASAQENDKDWTDIIAAKGGLDQSAAINDSSRILNQEEIDALFGHNQAYYHSMDTEKTGVKAILNSSMVSYERLPMLDIVFDRLIRMMSTSLRNFTQDNVDVSLDSIESMRFGEYIDALTLPTLLGVFKAEEWDNYGLISIDSSLVYSIVDVLLGGAEERLPFELKEDLIQLLSLIWLKICSILFWQTYQRLLILLPLLILPMIVWKRIPVLQQFPAYPMLLLSHVCGLIWKIAAAKLT